MRRMLRDLVMNEIYDFLSELLWSVRELMTHTFSLRPILRTSPTPSTLLVR